MTTRHATQQWAGFYKDVLGWLPVPLAPGSKACLEPDWATRAGRGDFTPDMFTSDSNHGLASFNGVTVFDDDCAKRGLRMRREFLPNGGAFYGRQGAPDSKALYLSTDLTETKTWADLKGDHLCQLRVGQQDMAPPSIHPCGEPLKWSQRLYAGMLTDVPAATLIEACNLRSTAALIALHWPEHGRRELLLAFARVLLETLGLKDDVAKRVLVLAAELGQFDSDGLDKAKRAVRSTRAALDKHAHALGSGHIRRAIPEGAALLRRLREWFGKTSAVEEAIERLNDQYFMIDVGNQTVIGEQIIESDGSRSWTTLRFRSFDEFRNKLVKQIVQVGTKQVMKDGVKTDQPVFKPVADTWIRHAAGLQYDRLVYAPDGSGVLVGARDLNGWCGFTVTPAPGAWSRTRDELIWTVMCRQSEALFNFTLDWMAALVQKPGRHAETALVFTGPQGVGKNVVAGEVLAHTFDGRHARVTTHTRQVLGDFNDILSGLCLLVLDEAELQRQAEYSAIKGLITGHTIDINRKNIQIATERSMLHVILLSNHDTPIKVAADDRRFVFYHFADTYQNDTAFFAAVARELDNGGRAAMLHELLTRPVDWDRLRLAPDTTPKREAKRESWTSAQWFFYRMLRDVDPLDWATHDRLRRLKKTDTVAEYQRHLVETNARREIKDARSELHQEIRKLVPREFDFNRPVSEGGVTSRDWWTLPDFDTFCVSFASAVGCDVIELLSEERGDVASVSDRAFADRDTELPF